jgi:hypothetical protein
MSYIVITELAFTLTTKPLTTAGELKPDGYYSKR